MEPPVWPLAPLDERQVLAHVVEQTVVVREGMRSDGDRQRSDIVIQAVAKIRIWPAEAGVLEDAGAVSKPVQVVEPQLGPS